MTLWYSPKLDLVENTQQTEDNTLMWYSPTFTGIQSPFHKILNSLNYICTILSLIENSNNVRYNFISVSVRMEIGLVKKQIARKSSHAPGTKYILWKRILAVTRVLPMATVKELRRLQKGVAVQRAWCRCQMTMYVHKFVYWFDFIFSFHRVLNPYWQVIMHH